MKIGLNEENDFLLEEVYNPVTFQTKTDEGLGVVMRDSGYELAYVVGEKTIRIELKEGRINYTTEETQKGKS